MFIRLLRQSAKMNTAHSIQKKQLMGHPYYEFLRSMDDADTQQRAILEEEQAKKRENKEEPQNFNLKQNKINCHSVSDTNLSSTGLFASSRTHQTPDSHTNDNDCCSTSLGLGQP